MNLAAFFLLRHGIRYPRIINPNRIIARRRSALHREEAIFLRGKMF